MKIALVCIEKRVGRIGSGDVLRRWTEGLFRVEEILFQSNQHSARDFGPLESDMLLAAPSYPGRCSRRHYAFVKGESLSSIKSIALHCIPFHPEHDRYVEQKSGISRLGMHARCESWAA